MVCYRFPVNLGHITRHVLLPAYIHLPCTKSSNPYCFAFGQVLTRSQYALYSTEFLQFYYECHEDNFYGIR
jgi:hypothetical protein